MSRDDLLEQVELQKTIEKMVGKDIKVSDEEITKYLEENQDFIPAETKPEDAKKQAEDQLYQQKLNEKVRPWLDKLQKDAKIFYFVNY